MPLVVPDAWRPRGIADLEPNAWHVLRRQGNTCVVAGPGAGKTEFLAQRAAYLLETGACPEPHRVLAISFKTDAAENLAARVRERCERAQADRFVSMTFDAFTKSLVDRFLPALAADWRPTRPYGIDFSRRPQVEDFLTRARLAAPQPWQAVVAGLGPSDFESKIVGSFRLPLQAMAPATAVEFVIERWWSELLRRPGRSLVTFTMLNRLAELLLRARPQIARALHATYPFVFVDEFQDTTHAQYDFLLSAFGDPRITVTAVGDDKQRIMVWAGARTDAFDRFEAEFAAERVPLLVNFRSSPDLVRIQHVVAQALDAGAIPTVAQSGRRVDGDVAQVWTCPTAAGEAQHLAGWLAQDMAARGTRPRDYAILVRQTADRFEEQLAPTLAAVNLRLRNESRALGRTTLQDLLVDAYAEIAQALLRLGVARRAPAAWQIASDAVLRLRDADPDDELACLRAEEGLSMFLQGLRATMAATPPSTAAAEALADVVLTFVDAQALARSFSEYATGDTLAIALEAFRLHLAACADGSPDWATCLDCFTGVDQVPLMTVHKSKGLEYDTILFVGLDDAMWWSHSAGNPEGIATFFVALSRAKQRAIFTFCRERGQRTRVADLYGLLTAAGVPEVAC
ncbi:DNA helicase UvrD [Microvirga vignae]|uniref:DNA 3'-5' helicase n=1 Tax=Microvirga vignae TaxID=1225564 RepID=A0A0H1R9J7_9HYPH|nr:ATP-dependent helicase [Microvirga vignae]KLK91880.1 DNA helicase UvrD [Microvirga vignae]